jgi:hypothetical protein
MPSPADVVSGSSSAHSDTFSCPNCGQQTPSGFAFCQQCGFKIPPAAPARGPGSPPIVSGQVGGGEAIAATLAAPNAGAALRGPSPSHSAPQAPPQAAHVPGPPTDIDAAPGWGTLVSVNRDGTDGESFALKGDWAIVGRTGADVAFDDDRFLAQRHARFEHTGGGARVVPMDELNGVYLRVDDPIEVRNGSTLLLGREVLRFEHVDDDEKSAHPLVRHGVALFGSPPRKPWGRLIQMLPNGGVRDIRYLWQDEIVVGREEGDIVFRDDAFLSRVHASLRWENGRCILDDKESSNGTFMRLSGPAHLDSGDHLRLGDQLFRFEVGNR